MCSSACSPQQSTNSSRGLTTRSKNLSSEKLRATIWLAPEKNRGSCDATTLRGTLHKDSTRATRCQILRKADTETKMRLNLELRSTSECAAASISGKAARACFKVRCRNKRNLEHVRNLLENSNTTTCTEHEDARLRPSTSEGPSPVRADQLRLLQWSKLRRPTELRLRENRRPPNRCWPSGPPMNS